MTKKLVKLRSKRKIILILFIALLGFSGCKPENPFVYTLISGEVEINETEKIFEFTKPFKPSRQVNLLCFTFEQAFERDSTMPPPRFPDGVPLVVDNILVDDRGNKYKLNKLSERGGQLVCYVPEDFQNWLDISKQRVSFVRLIVRSNRPIKASKIEWKSHNAWDMK